MHGFPARAAFYGSRSGGCCASAGFRAGLPISCFEKRGCRPLAGSDPSTKERVLSAVAIGYAIGRRGAWLARARSRERSLSGMVVIVTAGGEPEASGRMRQALGSEAAAGEGTGSAVFRTGKMVAGEVDVWPGTSSTDRDP